MSAPTKIPGKEPFDPNIGDKTGGFPVYDHAYDVETYAQFFTGAGVGNRDISMFERWVNDTAASAKSDISKSLTLPPEMASFARFSLLPEVHNGGVIQCPGLPPEVLRKIVRENLIPQVIIGLRVADVLRYSRLSKHPWKAGWQIKLRAAGAAPTEQDKKDIIEAQNFLLNCNIETRNARARDKKKLTDFGRFLSELVRDSLTYDGMAIWTERDLQDRVKAFKAYSAFNIRLCGPLGYKGDPNVYSVAVDEAGQVLHEFTREELTWYVRNPRADSDIFGYGYPEIEMAVRLIQCIQNAIDLNADIFNRNSIPNGFLTVKGMWGQRQLDVLSRIWQNLKRGVSKSWALPVIPIPKDGEIDVLDLSRLKENEAYYAEWMNMSAGLFCSIYRFPVKRLGYHISGKNRDNEPPVPTTTAPAVDDYDPYLGVLLHQVSDVINEYLIWDRWPQLEHCFTGSDPREDAREYEARTLASTVDERRALHDQEPLENLAKGEEEKQIARLMGQAPVDPALGGIYQTAIQVVMAPKEQSEGAPGAAFTSKKDPARAESHGHTSGTRRDSAGEKGK